MVFQWYWLVIAFLVGYGFGADPKAEKKTKKKEDD